MKYLVYLLLGLNLAYFVWHQTQPPQSSPAPQIMPLPPGIEPLVLLSERPRGNPVTTEPATMSNETEQVVEVAPDPAPAAATPVTDTPEIPAVVEVLPICHTIGPIKKRSEASELRGQLSQQDYPATLREGEIQAPSGYQVFLPEMSSKKAREVVNALKSAGMNDYYVGKRNHISLGIFSVKGKAQIRQQAVRKLGYDAMLDVRYKTRKVYWIDIEENNPASEPSEGWQQIVARYPQTQAQQVSCE